MTEYEIIKETPRAYLLSAHDGFEFWVSQNWFNAHTGELNERGQKAEEEARDDAESTEGLVRPEWVWENDKCVAVDYRVEAVGAEIPGLRGYRLRVFIPKGFLRDGGIKLDELERRKAEALENYRANELHESIRDRYEVQITGLWTAPVGDRR